MTKNFMGYFILHVFIGPPKIMSNQTQYGVEGDSVRIECVSFSVPKPDSIVWTFGGSEINSFHNQVIAYVSFFILILSLPFLQASTTRKLAF